MPNGSAQSLIVRALEAQARFVAAVMNFGLSGAIALFVRHRLLKPSGTFRLFIRKLGRPFFFRGNVDWGVMSHFYKPGYVINDRDSKTKVRTIVDAGANIGTETLRFRFFHPSATIIAVEAAKSNYDLLVKNIDADPAIHPVNAGLHSRACKLAVRNAGHSNESFRVVELPPDAEDYDVVGTTIPELMRTYRLDRIDILKLDIEGAEKSVFDATADAWIGQVKALIFECPDADAPGTTAQIFDVLKRNGISVRTYLHGECLILIRDDVDWSVEADLLFDHGPSYPMASQPSEALS